LRLSGTALPNALVASDCGYKEIELALGGAHLGQIEVEEADGVAREILSLRPVSIQLG
jgi:hypothetical protein